MMIAYEGGQRGLLRRAWFESFAFNWRRWIHPPHLKIIPINEKDLKANSSAKHDNPSDQRETLNEKFFQRFKGVAAPPT